MVKTQKALILRTLDKCGLYTLSDGCVIVKYKWSRGCDYSIYDSLGNCILTHWDFEKIWELIS